MTLSEHADKVDHGQVDALYEESGHWHLNTGDQVIHAKRMPGKFRTVKWFTMSVWLIFFLGPYLRWNGHQAVLFDIPNRQFHIFGITVLPQDVWMLSLVLLFFAILLAVVTAIAGRVFCGYFCFQTVWTDIFTWLEEKLEGPPAKRFKLDKAPWDAHKIRVKVTKHIIWIAIGMLTGLSFAAWFVDAPTLWRDYLTLNATTMEWAILGAFTAGTYVLAGFMREQVCFWLCPYARIQSVMYDRETILPTYDYNRGEPRGKLKKGQAADEQGDCIDCGQCVAVCPTGIDIRMGQQEGCITCSLCIDACDSVMEKIKKPKGLIRYASLAELEGKAPKAFFKRPRVLVYGTILLVAISGIIYGLSTINGIQLKALHERQPLFVLQSDGSIQNRYTIKILNKTNGPIKVKLTAKGFKDMKLVGTEKPFEVDAGNIGAYTVFIRVPHQELKQEVSPIYLHAEVVGHAKLEDDYKSMFFGPQRHDEDEDED